MQKLRAKKGSDPVYALEDAATGLYLNIDGEAPRAVGIAEASRFPATTDGLLELCTRIAAIRIAAPYDLVRVDVQ